MCVKKPIYKNGVIWLRTKQPNYRKNKNKKRYIKNRSNILYLAKIKVKCNKCHQFVCKSYLKNHQQRKKCKRNSLMWDIRNPIALNNN